MITYDGKNHRFIVDFGLQILRSTFHLTANCKNGSNGTTFPITNYFVLDTGTVTTNFCCFAKLKFKIFIPV